MSQGTGFTAPKGPREVPMRGYITNVLDGSFREAFRFLNLDTGVLRYTSTDDPLAADNPTQDEEFDDEVILVQLSPSEGLLTSTSPIALSAIPTNARYAVAHIWGDAISFTIDGVTAPDFAGNGERVDAGGKVLLDNANDISRFSVVSQTAGGGSLYVKYYNREPSNTGRGPSNRVSFVSSLSATVVENQTAALALVGLQTDGSTPATPGMFSITGGVDAADFTIDASGVLTFVASPDFETPVDDDLNNVYEVEVTLDDGMTQRVEIISITVSDVADTFTAFTSPATVSIAEPNTSGLPLSGVQSDGVTPATVGMFSIVGGADAALFSIDGSGQLVFNSATDFESPADADGNNVYEVDVQLTDGIFPVVQSHAITVTDVADTLTAFTSPTTVSMAENNTVAIALTGVQSDGVTPATAGMFTIVGGADAALFSIDSSGQLVFNSAPDFESPADAGGNNVYDVDIQLSDGIFPVTQSHSITVTDVAEGPTLLVEQLNPSWINVAGSIDIPPQTGGIWNVAPASMGLLGATTPTGTGEWGRADLGQTFPAGTYTVEIEITRNLAAGFENPINPVVALSPTTQFYGTAFGDQRPASTFQTAPYVGNAQVPTINTSGIAFRTVTITASSSFRHLYVGAVSANSTFAFAGFRGLRLLQ